MNLHLTIGPIVSRCRRHFDPCDAATAEPHRRDPSLSVLELLGDSSFHLKSSSLIQISRLTDRAP